VAIQEVLEKLIPREAPKAPSPALKPEPRRPPAGAGRSAMPQVVIEGMDNLMIRFARCCSPVFGDPLTGIITRGRGVSIHHRDCPALGRQVYHSERLVEVSWVDEHRKDRPVTLAISTRKSMKELLSLITLLEDEGTPITSGRITARQGVYTQHLTLRIDDSKHLKRILQRLNAIAGVRAERVLESA
jgi:GTP pyrophosphokinase